jgi:hypothetical protein
VEPLTLADLFFGLPAVGHVPCRPGDRLDLPVLAEDGDEDVLVDAAAERAGEGDLTLDRLLRGDDLLDLPVVHLGVPRLVAEFEAGLPDGLVPGLAPHPEQALVGVGEAVVEVEDVDQVRGVREDGVVKPLATVGLPRPPRPVLLGQLPLRPVPHDLGEAPELAALVPQGRHRPAAPEPGAVLADVPAVVVPPPRLQRLLHLPLRVAPCSILRSEEGGDGPPDDFVLPVAEQPLGPWVPAFDPALRVDDEDGVVPDVLDQQTEEFAFVLCRVGLLDCLHAR